MLDVKPQELLADVAEKRIYDYLKDNNYKPGDSFPREKDLTDMLNTSRPIVREALSRFRMLGILKSRKRRGMIFSKPKIFEILKKVIDPIFLPKSEQQDFYNLRIIIELGLADVLAFNITDKDIEKLEAIVQEEEKDPKNCKTYFECDYKFHLQIYKSTGCTALESFQTLLHRAFSGSPDEIIKSKNFETRFEDPNLCSHRDLLEAIKSGIPDVIHSTMKKHLYTPLEKLKKSTMKNKQSE